MYSLLVSELADKDLDSIVSYIAVQLANPIAATNLLDEIEKCYAYLKSNPFIYERCHDAYLDKKGYRKVTIKNYVLVYMIDEANRTVVIHRFFYGAQDYVKLI